MLFLAERRTRCLNVEGAVLAPDAEPKATARGRLRGHCLGNANTTGPAPHLWNRVPLGAASAARRCRIACRTNLPTHPAAYGAPRRRALRQSRARRATSRPPRATAPPGHTAHTRKASACRLPAAAGRHSGASRARQPGPPRPPVIRTAEQAREPPNAPVAAAPPRRPPGAVASAIRLHRQSQRRHRFPRRLPVGRDPRNSRRQTAMHR